MSDQEDQIARVYAELKDGTFLQKARQRSQRRKSVWNLLLLGFIPIWLLLAFVVIELFLLLHVAIYPEQAGYLRKFWRSNLDVAGLLMFAPPFIATIPIAMVVINFLVYLIPPARRAMDKEDRNIPGVDYHSSQRALIKIGAVATVVAVLLASIGAAIRTSH